ncbi:ABC transporter substrate-binding protein [bacterium]|nr:ABC transporter substrate-binding protein [bacterium]
MKIAKVLSALVLCVSLLLGTTQFVFGQKEVSLTQYATIAEYEKATGKKITKFSEAPMLQELVKQGKLPPVEKRLPEEPAVIQPLEEIGQYGGTWRRAWLGPSDSPGPGRITYDNTLRWDLTGTKIMPNVAKSWKISKDGKTVTLSLRKGMKWSDGAPFTADDVIFWYEDIILNKEITPTFPVWLTAGGVPGKIKKVDDYTVQIQFEYPNGLILEFLAANWIFAPKHYLKQFHPKYTDQKTLEEAYKKAGFDAWYKYFQNRNDWIQNPDLPTIRAWKPSNPPDSKVWVMERNPYYWKIDTAGNQLPYIDRITHELVANAEMVTMKAVAGELDMQLRHINFMDYTLLKENEKKGDYRVIRWLPALGADVGIFINQNLKDQVLKKFFTNPRFRQALSIAINRDEINQLIYHGVGKPRAATVIPQSVYYDPSVEKLYAEYDPAKANKILDDLGLKKRGPDGYRLRPDGKTFSVTINVAPVFGPWIDVCEMVKGYWEKLGIKTAVNTMERALLYSRAYAGDFEMMAWSVDRSSQPWSYPCWWVPMTNECFYAPLTGVWYTTGGKGGEEPTSPELKKIIELYNKMKVTTDATVRTRLAKEILRLHAKNVFVIGTVGLVPSTMCVGVVKNYFKNVPDETHGAVSDVIFNSPGNGFPVQFFIKK